MTKKSRLILLTLVFSFFSSFAGIDEDVPGSKDHPIISRFNGSVIIGYEQKNFDQLLLILGKQLIDPVKGNYYPEKSQKVEGRLTRILYVAPEGTSSLEVFRNYEIALKKAGFKIIFQCQQDSCGRRMSQIIYPVERRLKNRAQKSELAFASPKDQHYLAAQLEKPEGIVYVSLYLAVNDFNNCKDTYNRVIVLLEIVEPTTLESGKVKINAQTIARNIENTGHAAIYGIYFELDSAEIKAESEETLAEIAKFLKTNQEKNFFLIGHTDNSGELSYNLDLSQRRAEAVLKALINRYGIKSTQLLARGVGPFAPVASNTTEEGRALNRRVELVAGN